MDIDLLSSFLADSHPSESINLLSNLSNSSLTPPNVASRPSEQVKASAATTQFSPVNRNSPGAVINKIEDIFEAMTDCILGEKKELSIRLKTRDKSNVPSNDANSSKKKTKSESRIVTFPSKSPQEAWKFSKCCR